MRPLDLASVPKPQESQRGKKGKAGFLLVAGPAGYRHRGIDISSKVGGLGELALEEGFRMNPEDLVSCGLKHDDAITLSFDGGKVSVSGPARSDSECPRGVIYCTRPVVFGGLGHRRGLWPLYRLEENPTWVSLSGTTPGTVPFSAWEKRDCPPNP
jgi:hypothetical protein